MAEIDNRFLQIFKDFEFVKAKGTCEKHGDFESNIFKGSGDVPKCPLCEAEKEAQKERKAYEITLHNKGIRARFFNENFTTYNCENERQTKIIQTLQTLIDTKQNTSVLLYGTSGTGKTHLLSSAVKAFYGKAFYTTWQELDLILRSTYKQDARKSEYDVLQSLIDLDFLAIDEIEKASDTENKVQKLSLLFRERYENVKPTWLAGNCTVDWIKTNIDPAVIDRLRENGASFCFDWKSYRNGK